VRQRKTPTPAREPGLPWLPSGGSGGRLGRFLLADELSDRPGADFPDANLGRDVGSVIDPIEVAPFVASQFAFDDDVIALGESVDGLGELAPGQNPMPIASGLPFVRVLWLPRSLGRQ
jgi:hypothetical protein